MSEFFPWTREKGQQNHAKTVKCHFAMKSKLKNSVKNGHQKFNYLNETNIQQINTACFNQMRGQKLFASFASNPNLVSLVHQLSSFLLCLCTRLMANL